MRDIVTNYIYPNTLAVVRVTGSDLRQALEKSASYFSLSPSGQYEVSSDFMYPKAQQYNYDMYAGIDYIIDVSFPVGKRISQLTYSGKPIQENDELEVVINQYRAVGGGNYDMFSADKIIREITVDMTELIADYFKKHDRITPDTFNNFQVIQSKRTACQLTQKEWDNYPIPFVLIKLEHYSELVEIRLIASAQTKNSFELIELRLITSTQIENDSELIELRLITLTQIENGSELIELSLVTSTQIENDSELVELRVVMPTQIKLYVQPVSNFPSRYRISNGETYCNILISLCHLTTIFLLMN